MSSTNVNNYPSKGNIQWRTITEATISANDVVNYIQNDVFGFPIKASLITWHGPNKGCYVVSKIAIAANDLAVTNRPTNFVTKVLDGYNANTLFKKDVLDLIEPFQFPTLEALDLAMRDPVRAANLAKLGIAGSNYQELRNFRDFRYSPSTGYYIIYLDTEKIIKQYVEDPTVNKITGKFAITRVYGEKDEQIRWDVRVVRDEGGFNSLGGPLDVSLDRILATVR